MPSTPSSSCCTRHAARRAGFPAARAVLRREYQDQQNLAIANCLAQAEAFMAGNPAPAVRAELEKQKLPRGQAGLPRRLWAKGVFRGSPEHARIVFPQLDPQTLGRLCCRCTSTRCSRRASSGASTPSTSGGVELGKKLAEQLARRSAISAGGHAAPQRLARLLEHIRKMAAGSLIREDNALCRFR